MKNIKKNDMDQQKNQQNSSLSKQTLEKFTPDTACKLFTYECPESTEDFDEAEALTGMLIW